MAVTQIGGFGMPLPTDPEGLARINVKISHQMVSQRCRRQPSMTPEPRRLLEHSHEFDGTSRSQAPCPCQGGTPGPGGAAAAECDVCHRCGNGGRPRAAVGDRPAGGSGREPPRRPDQPAASRGRDLLARVARPPGSGPPGHGFRRRSPAGFHRRRQRSGTTALQPGRCCTTSAKPRSTSRCCARPRRRSIRS